MAGTSAHTSLAVFLKNTTSVGVLALSLIYMSASQAKAQTSDRANTTPPVQDSSPTDDAIDEIVVTGRRAAQNETIEAKRNAKQIIDTLSAAESGRLPDNNIAESLSRITGITTLRNGDTGDGDFISIRGLDSALNNVQFNGVNSGQASAGDRRVPLDGINADDISEIRVAKFLLPQDEGEGIGGSINIISKTPLERGEDQFRFEASGRYNEFSDKTGYEFGAGFTKIFNDKFGVSASINTRRRYLETIELNANSTNPARLPVIRDSNGNVISVDDIIDGGGEFNQPGDSYDNVEAGLFSSDDITFEDYLYELSKQQRDTLSLSGAIDWQVSNTTLLTLGGFLSQEDNIATETIFGFDVDEDEFANINGVAVTLFDDAEVDFRGRIEDEEEINGNIYLKGVTELDRLTLDYQASYAHASDESPVYELEFDTGSFLPNDTSITTYVPWVYQGRYFAHPNLAVLQDPDFVQAFTDLEGTQIGDDFEYRPVNEQKNDRYAVQINGDYEVDQRFLGFNVSSIRLGTKFERSDVSRRQIVIADDIEDVDFNGLYNEDGDGTAEDALLENFAGLFGGFDQRALENIGSPLSAIGIDGFPSFNEASLRNFFSEFGRSYTSSGSDSVASDTLLEFREEVFSAYVQTELEWEKLNVILGARIEDYTGEFSSPSEVEAEIFLENFDGGSVDLLSTAALDNLNIKTGNTEVLPRMAFTYDVSDTFILRGGAGYSIARPTFRQLARATEFELGLVPNADAPGLTQDSTATDIAAAGLALGDYDPDEISFTIFSGNPALENAKSLNLDLSAEFYPSSSTAFSAGVFYKEIDNFIFVGAESDISGAFDDSISEGILANLTDEGRQILENLGGLSALIENGEGVTLIQPSNGDTAEIYGLELGLIHAFDWAPGILRDMGITANVTFTESEATYDVATLEEGQDYLVAAGFYEDGDILRRTTSFFAAPDISGNASIYYEANDLEIALSASYQSAAFDATDDYGLDQFNDEYFQADFFIGYKLPIEAGSYSVFLEVADFTDGGTKATDAQSVGRNGSIFDEASFNGREVKFGLRGRF